MRRNIEWPKVPEDISLEAYDFINKLLSVDVSQRLGSGELDAEEVKRHPFLQDVDWESLLSEDAAVFVPQLECQTDTSYFDEDRQGSMGGVLRDISLTEKSGVNISPQSFVASTPKPFSSTTSGGPSTSIQSASFATSSSFALSSPPSSSVFSPWPCSDHGDTGSASPSKEYDVFSDFGYTNVPNLQSLTLEKTKKRK